MKNIIFSVSFLSCFLSTCITIVEAAGYDISSLPVDQKQTICDKHIAFCTNTCNGNTLRNSCNASTMVFDCACSAGPLPVSLHYFPIQAQQCVGETQDCRDMCVANDPTGKDVVACSARCDKTFACGTAAAAEKMNFSPDASLTGSVSGTGRGPQNNGDMSGGPYTTSNASRFLDLEKKTRLLIVTTMILCSASIVSYFII